MYFFDRQQAAQKLIAKIQDSIPHRDNCILLALPRGGVVTGAYIRDALHIPMDIMVMKKIVHPDNLENVLGAVSAQGQVVFDHPHKSDHKHCVEIIQKTIEEAQQRMTEFRGTKPYPSLQKKHVILVDDGLATGTTMGRAVKIVRVAGARTITVAVPVASCAALVLLQKIADHVICLEHPELFSSVRQFYVDYPIMQDDEVRRLL